MTSAYAFRSPLLLTSASFGLSFLRDAPSDKRKQSIEFHVASGDYFGTIATTLGLIADTSSGTAATSAKRYLEDIRDELAYMQETHTIERKVE